MTTWTRALSTDPWVTRPGVNLDTEVGQVGVLDPATVHRAQVAVCERAANVDEARMLLAMLGIGEPV